MSQVMTAEEIAKAMNDQARVSARDVNLSGVDEQDMFVSVPAGLPEPQLWELGEFESLALRMAAAAEAADSQRKQQGDAMDYLATTESASAIEPVDLTDPLKHIRDMIVADMPEAAMATDEELGVLYDQWEAKQELKDDTGRTEKPV